MTIYTSISGGEQRRGVSNNFDVNMDNGGDYVYHRGEYVEEEKQSLYQTPESYSTRRRIKKKERYEDIEDQGFTSTSKNYDFDSTNCTKEASDLARLRHQRRRDFMIMNTSSEQIQQVVVEDESIEDIDEEEECASIPSEEKSK
jgi:hypothetical protein